MNQEKPQIPYRDLTRETLASMIDRGESFVVIEINENMTQAIALIEEVMKEHGKLTRVYTAYRSSVIAAAAIPTGATQLLGGLAAAAIGVHNAATCNPDYLIAKMPFGDKYLEVNKQDVELDEKGQRRGFLSYAKEYGENGINALKKYKDDVDRFSAEYAMFSDQELIKIYRKKDDARKSVALKILIERHGRENVKEMLQK